MVSAYHVTYMAYNRSIYLIGRNRAGGMHLVGYRVANMIASASSSSALPTGTLASGAIY